MPIEKIYLGEKRDFIGQAADVLLERYVSGQVLDLQKLVLVSGGKRAGRLLLETLARECASRGLSLVPPRFCSAGELPEVLLAGEDSCISDKARLLVWMAALREGLVELEAVVSEPPAVDDVQALRVLAGTIDSLYVELAGACLTFREVAAHCAAGMEYNDEERWQALAGLEVRFAGMLQRHGLLEKHSLRRKVLAEEVSPRYSGEVCLLGCADLAKVSQELLLRWSGDALALVCASEELAANFNECGCIDQKKWAASLIEIPDEIIRVAGSPGDQADVLVDALAALAGKYSSEDISIGLCDEELTPFTMQRLAARGLSGRPAAAEKLSNSQVFSLLTAVRECLNSGRFQDFAALARHPDFEAWLARKAGEEWDAAKLAGELDRYQQEHYQGRFALPDVPEKFATLKSFAVLSAEVLSSISTSSRLLVEWAAPLNDLLIEIYGAEGLSRSSPAVRELLEFCKALDGLFAELEALPGEFLPKLAAGQALGLILPMLEDLPLPADPRREALEILEWLELQLDNAPALVIGGVNEGLVPEALTADMFLPETLRRELGLLDNERRYARDVYLLTSILGSRQVLCLSAGRRTLSGDPLQPSRLLSACPHEKQAARVSYLYAESEGEGAHLETPEGSVKNFEIIREPEPLAEPVAVMSVTSFSDYLKCPYRFYLRHVLGLKRVSDDAQEMDALAFGSLAHRVLQCLAEQPELALSAERKIFTFLVSELDTLVSKRFGSGALASVYVQLEQLKQRLKAFASWQAGWAAAGWRIRASELAFNEDKVSLDFGEGRMGLRGCIDRLDYNEKAGLWAVLDYKTGDKAKNLNDVWTEKKGWKDLQLPLYRHALCQLGYKGEFCLSYVSIAASAEDTREVNVPSGADELAAANQVACEVSRKVQAQEFWPPASSVLFDDYAALFTQFTGDDTPLEASDDE